MSSPTLQQMLSDLRAQLVEIVEHPDFIDSRHRLIAVITENAEEEDNGEEDENATQDYEIYVGGDLIDATDMAATFVHNLLEETETKDDQSIVVSTILHTLQDYLDQDEG